MPQRDGVHKLVIIGGGPAGVGVLVRAARLGYLPRLLDPAKHGTPKDLESSGRCGWKQLGLTILHDGDVTTFGAGNLGSYIINSNTFAKSMLSSVLDEKPELEPPESIQNTFLERARDHPSTKKLEEIGAAPVCLVDMGNFLAHIGTCALGEVAKHHETSSCLMNTRATKFQLMENGFVRVEAQSNGRPLVLHTEFLVLAMGGYQQPPTLENPAKAAKVFLADSCLRETGFAALREHLLQAKDKKVCIVGGSHSSFSVAWLLLHKFQTAGGSTKVLVSTPSKEVIRSTGTGNAISPVKDPSRARVHNSVFAPKDITILHRSPIRCYYMTRKEAEADGADGSRVDRTGCVNTFTGLREDSKNLYKDIRSGRETRVRLFQVNQQGSQLLTTKAYESASAIVWSCGYQTRMIPAFDQEGIPLQFVEDHGVLKLDLEAHLQLRPKGAAKLPQAMTNVLGVGLGFSLRSAVDEMGTETRADGVTVYHRRGASLVLAALFGREVYGRDCATFEEMVDKNDRKKKEHTTSKNGDAPLVERLKKPTVSRCESASSSGNNNVASSKITIQFSPDKPSSDRRKSSRGAVLDTAATPSKAATNPPVKLLLDRRRNPADAQALVAEPRGRDPTKGTTPTKQCTATSPTRRRVIKTLARDTVLAVTSRIAMPSPTVASASC